MVDNVVAAVVFTVLLGGVLRFSVALWNNYRDPSGALRRTELSAAGGMTTADPHLRRARVRCQIPVLIGFWGLPLYFVPQVVEIVVSWDWSMQRSPFFDRPLNVVEIAALLLVVVGFLLYQSVVYFNVPTFLVPTDMRRDPGLLAVRRALSRGEDASALYEDKGWFPNSERGDE